MCLPILCPTLKDQTHVIGLIYTGLDNNTIPLSPCLYCSHLLNLRSITVVVLSASPSKQFESPAAVFKYSTCNNKQFEGPHPGKDELCDGIPEESTQRCHPPSIVFHADKCLHASFITVGNLHALCDKSVHEMTPQLGLFRTLIQVG